MKKLFLFLFLLLPISVFAWDSCNSDNVIIENISMVDSDGYVVENNSASTNGKMVSTDVKLYDVGDSITYNIKLKNNSGEDYSLDKIFTNSDNVKYEIISDNNKLLSKEEKDVKLKITYTKKVDDSMYKSGKYIENRELDMVITNSIKNPITSSINKIIVILLLIVFLLISSLLIKRDIKNSSLLLLLLLFIPVFVKAECRYVLRINSNIVLKKVIPNHCYESSSGENPFKRMIDGYGKKYNNINEESEVYGYNSVENGYSVYLKNINSTEPITERICTSINGLPIVSMKDLFSGSKAISIDLSSFDTSNVTDMSGMFYNSQATSLDLSSFDTSNVTDMSGMFYNSQATSIDLSSFDTNNVTNMRTMFYNSQVRNLDLSSFDTSNVTNMMYMFSGSQATSLNLSSFNTSNVSNMTSMFENSVVKELDLSSFNTSNVINMSSMFSGCQSLSIDLSSFDTSKVTNMSSMFNGCLATTLDLSSFDTGNVTNMNSMFDESKATSINVSSFDTSKVTSMNSMFKSCKVTTPFDLSNFTSESLTDINWMFGYTSMPTLDISGFSLTNDIRKSFTFQGSTINTVYVKSQETLDILRRYDSSNNPMIPSTMNLVIKE